MSHIFRILLTLLSIAICKALPDVHKYMSPLQLQSVFHVDNVANVPHYEVVQLLHHNSDPGANVVHYRNRRSINSASKSVPPKEPHHVKKDLSKNPYYSELKAAAAAAGGDAVNSVYAHTEKLPRKFGADLSQMSEHNVSFSAFGELHNLTLRATDGLFKGAPHKLRMWTVNSKANETHGLDLEEVFDGHNNSDEIGHVFQDEKNMAAILMRRHLETGDLIMEGSIGHEMVIKPLPHDLSPSEDRAHHIVYKREPAKMDHLSDFAFMEPDDLATHEKLEELQQQHRRRRSANLADMAADEPTELAADELADEDEMTAEASLRRGTRQAPYMIYPEVLVIVDYDGYRLHGGDNLQVKRYFVSFWNGVDLRYRLLKGPRIRISIAGIIISRGRDATPYLERNRVGRDAIDSAAALTDMGKYLFRERRLPVYDIAVAITKYDMCRRRKGGRCTKGTAGFAYVGGACVVNKRLEKVNSVAIIEDTGGFSGIIVAAHEVGHLLGAVHDGSPPPSYLGGPGAQHCRWEDGYIMSDLRHTERGFRWSPCTVQSFHHFLNGDTATCLHNQPHEDGALGRSLPGTLLSLDAQCRRDRGTYACFKDERVCAQLFCFDAQTGYCVAYRPAAEGSACGNGLHCLDGRCTTAITNTIGYGPKYSIAYNNSDATKSSENTDNSSEEDEDSDEYDEEDGEAELDGNDEHEENSSKSKEDSTEDEDENSLQKLQKNDNSFEETSLEITDERNNTQTAPTIQKTTASTTTTRPTTILTRTQQNTHTNPTQIQSQLNAIDYIKYILQYKAQWQQLLSPTTSPITHATKIPTGTTIIATTQNPNYNGGNKVLVKTSTSSSVSFSSSRSNGSNNNKNSYSNSYSSSAKNSISNYSRSSNSSGTTCSNEITDSQQTPENDQGRQYHQKQDEEEQQQQQHKQQQQQQQQEQEHRLQKPKLDRKTQEQQKQHTQNTLKNFSTDFRKQYQHYIKLLNRNNGIKSTKKSSDNNGSSVIRSGNSSSINDSSPSSSSIVGILKTPKKTTQNAFTAIRRKSIRNLLESPTNSPNSNYSSTATSSSSSSNKNNNHTDDDDDNSNDDNDNIDDDNEEDDNENNDDNVESNEAIDKQKRKFDVKITTRLQQEQQKKQKSNAGVQQTARNIIFGSRTPTTARSNSFLDAYFKKLQALNAQPAQSPIAQTSPLPTITSAQALTTISSTSSISSSSSSSSSSATASESEKSSSSSKGSTTTATSSSLGFSKKQQQQLQQKQFDKFAGHFLKRTPVSYSKNNRNGSHSNINNNNNSHNNHNHNEQNHESKHNNSNNKSSYENHRPQQDDNVPSTPPTTATITTSTTAQKQHQQQQAAFVTNYIGDPSNNLPAIVVNDENRPLHILNAPTQTTFPQFEQQQQQQQHQQKQHKIKTQKLIRRQLRTQIK